MELMYNTGSITHTHTYFTNYTQLMSDEKKNQPTDKAATQPIKKTSAVPLRKETVRVTLKAPGAKPGGAPAGVEVPASSPSKPAPTLKLGESAGLPPKSLAVAPTIPLGSPTAPLAPPAASPVKQETMRVTLKADKDGKAPAAPVPTVPLGGVPKAPAVATPAPTMKLGGSPTVPLATQPLNAPVGGGASQPLPKATVELQQTQQLTQGVGAPTQVATIQTVSEGDEVQRSGNGAALPLSIVAFVLSLIVLYFQFDHAKIWVDEHQDGETMSIFEGVDE